MLALPILLLATIQPPAPALSHGPFLGDLTPTHITIWARAAADGDLTATLVPPADSGRPTLRAAAHAAAEHDDCITFAFDNLTPATRYTYTIRSAPEPITASFTTPPIDAFPARTTLAIGSCALEDAGTAACWDRIAAAGGGAGPDAVVLIGDTPYIDSTDLAVQRRRYREFAAVPSFARLLREHPLYSTWDDHDFGRNDTDGRLKGKEHSRQAFIEYRPNPSYGEHDLGVYTSFRRGPVEVFLLDTRWFSGTEPSPMDPAKKTLLGAQQWSWLRKELKASTAPFKLIVCGMIWNDAVRPGKPDYWGAYPAEREALFQFIGDNRIPGVVLVGGDIHRSRVLRHDSKAAAGYDLIELISSPMHGSVMSLANVPHPGLIKDMGVPHMFMLLTADATTAPAGLDAVFISGDGTTHFEFHLSAADLMPR